MKKEDILIPGLEDYDISGGTIMLTRDNNDPEIGVSINEAVDFMKKFTEKHGNFLYYAVRKSGAKAKDGQAGRVHIDFSFVIEKDLSDINNQKIGYFMEKVIRHEFYKQFGAAVEGYDMSARLRACCINTSLLSFNKNNSK